MRVLVLLFSLLVAACGGSSEPAGPTPATSPMKAADGHDQAKAADGHDQAETGDGHDHGDAAAAGFYCPMHPEVTSMEEGQRCGKCNMFLVKPGDEAKHTGG
ncbi:MAG: hypothetical protein KDA24_11490 [Deltaproteobacteria bacterium]|nr:hypothetical protein [Deltaproteobacteria bacterium]